MSATGEWADLVRRIESLELQLKEETEPAEMVRLDLELQELERREGELRPEGVAGRDEVPCPRRPGAEEAPLLHPLLEAWMDSELERALNDREFMARIFDEAESGRRTPATQGPEAAKKPWGD